VRAYAYQTFYRLPKSTRRRIVRMVAPKYLVGAVCVVRDSEVDGPDRLLLLRQPNHRGWNLPAGLLKRGEHPATGAARELHEESGVRLDPSDLTAGNPSSLVHHQEGVVDTIWLASVPASTTTLRVDGGEVLEAAWFPVDDLPRLTSNTAALLGHFGIGPRSTRQQS